MLTDAIERELLHVEEAARVMGISRAKAYELVAAGSMPGLVRLPHSRSVRVSRRHLQAWIDEQAGESLPLAR